MGYDWSKTNSRTPLPFFALSTLYQFEEKHNRVPDNISDSDLSELKSIINSSIEKFNLKNTDSNKYFEETKYVYYYNYYNFQIFIIINLIIIIY